MRKEQFEERLNSLHGATVMWKKENHKIANHMWEGEKLTIVTDKVFIKKDITEVALLLDSFLEVESEESVAIAHKQQESQMVDIIAVMRDNIERLRKDNGKEFVSQAKEINSHVKTFVEIYKIIGKVK